VLLALALLLTCSLLVPALGDDSVRARETAAQRDDREQDQRRQDEREHGRQPRRETENEDPEASGLTLQAAAVSAICPYRFTVATSGQAKRIPYCASRDLATITPSSTSSATRVVIVIHGSSRNADDYFSYVQGSASAAGVAGSTLVIAPQFLLSDDLGLPDVAGQADILYWDGGWREGEQSRTSNGKVSSYAVVDAFMRVALDTARFPALHDVVVTGHSAGGQFVTRFAAGSPVQGESAAAGKHFRYVIANPSSFLYYSQERRVAGSTTQFAVPSSQTQSSCPGWNDYKYGLLRIDPTVNPYMYSGGQAATVLQSRYTKREAIYLNGEDDVFNSDGMDTSCEAMLQGDQRFERATVYYNHLGRAFASSTPGIYTFHLRDSVPNVGHDAEGMYNSSQGRHWLFDVGAGPTPTPTATYTPGPSATPTLTPTPTRTPTATPAATSLHVGDLDRSVSGQGKNWTASVTIVVHNTNHAPVANATVNGNWSGGTSGSASCVTDSSGQCKVTKSGLVKRQVSSVTFTVSGVNGSLPYQSSANHDPDSDSNGTTITVNRP
jgi:hypothetical protein